MIVQIELLSFIVTIYRHYVVIHARCLFAILLRRTDDNIVHTLSLRTLYALVTVKNLRERPCLKNCFSRTHSLVHYRSHTLCVGGVEGMITLLISTDFLTLLINTVTDGGGYDVYVQLSCLIKNTIAHACITLEFSRLTSLWCVYKFLLKGDVMKSEPLLPPRISYSLYYIYLMRFCNMGHVFI